VYVKIASGIVSGTGGAEFHDIKVNTITAVAAIVCATIFLL